MGIDDALTIGKLRGLQQLADAQGLFIMTAMDHRGSLEKGLCIDPDADCFRLMVDFKLDLCRALAPASSGVLLDPIYGAAQAIASGALPGNTGLLVSVEATGYEGGKTARVTRLLDGWGVEKIKRLGASAVKMLVYFRPDSGDLATIQLDTVAKAAAQCREHDIPFLVEPVSYALDGESAEAYGAKKTDIVIATAKMMTALPIDVLKAEFPADMKLVTDEGRLLDACRALDAASAKPWVILSAGADFSVFRRQVELACRAGASGFLGGRAIWQEAVAMTDRDARRRFFETTALARLNELIDLTRQWGRPWYRSADGIQEERALPDADWYRNY
ncbi:MAG: tagatose 1,6-diphosphate aldolase [Dehalogenimonas sp.]|uniref:Tagatose 1,6-diphosphate aldolase n=1 Tax=Candidatus Dehalogenimonas loeffleri TaxID=3127115 RepID=A0ABZ2J693_9CHLR|nr:tagatose 1,6-diphosphate aldolase [Dehalogenimonas sp.]